MNFAPPASGQHMARMADITLNGGNDFAFQMDDPYADPFVFEEGLDSQIIDLNLDGMDVDQEANKEDDSMSVEVGRDAGNVSNSIERSYGDAGAGEPGGWGDNNIGNDLGDFNNFEFDVPEGGLFDLDAPVEQVPDLVGGAAPQEKAQSPACKYFMLLLASRADCRISLSPQFCPSDPSSG